MPVVRAIFRLTFVVPTLYCKANCIVRRSARPIPLKVCVDFLKIVKAKRDVKKEWVLLVHGIVEVI